MAKVFKYFCKIRLEIFFFVSILLLMLLLLILLLVSTCSKSPPALGLLLLLLLLCGAEQLLAYETGLLAGLFIKVAEGFIPLFFLGIAFYKGLQT